MEKYHTEEIEASINKFEEVSLKEIIQVLLSQKKLIIIITALFITAGLIFGITTPKRYEATSMLLTNPINRTALASNSQVTDNFLSSFGQNSQMDISTYKEQILNLSLLSQAIEMLNLSDKNNNPLSPEALRGKLDVSDVDKTNLLKITATDENPQTAADIVNVLSLLFIEYITELSREQSLMSSKLIEKQLIAEGVKLDEKSKELRDYLIDSVSIKELESNIGSLISQISRYKSDLNDLQRQISADRASLDILEPKAQNISKPKQDVLSSDYTIDVPLRKQNSSAGQSAAQSVTANLTPSYGLETTLLQMDISEMQTRLVSNESDYRLLEGQIESMEQQLSLLQATLAEEQYRYETIERECQLAAETYNAYQQLHKQIVISSAADIGKLNISISSSALPPNSPNGTNLTMILSICFMLGLFLSVFIALFKNYWDTAK